MYSYDIDVNKIKVITRYHPASFYKLIELELFGLYNCINII